MEKATVAVTRCMTYDEEPVLEAVRRAVDYLGGIKQYVQPGQRVLLKVNLLRAAAPTEAICTHPAFVKAVIRLVQEAGGQPIIGDSPGGPFRAAWLRQVYQRSGMVQLAEETGAELNWDFGQVILPHPEGRLIRGLEVGTYIANADVVIPLSKLKTHSFMGFTGATKILFGAIPGTAKMGYHAQFSDPERFGDMLLDILTLVRPPLSLMDGIIGMEGDGPAAGQPCEVGAVLASRDAVALDVVATALAGIDVNAVYPLRAAIARGLTTGRAADVTVLGEPLESFPARKFQMPHTQTRSSGFMSFITKFLKRWTVAAPQSTAACVGCGICKQNCPVDAIQISERRARMDLDRCIRCYCCHELCPERAINLHKPWLGRVIG